MHASLLMAAAILCEMAETSALRATEGFSRLWQSVAVVIGYAVSFFCLSLVLKQALAMGALLTNLGGGGAHHLGGEADIEPIWAGYVAPRIGGGNVQVTRFPADEPAQRRIINPLQSAADLTTNALGGAVSTSGLVGPGICSTPNAQGTVCLSMTRAVPSRSEPHKGRNGARTQPIFKANWTAPGGVLTNVIPAAQGNFSGYTAIQVRAAIDFSDTRNPATSPQNITCTLTDAAGNSYTVFGGGVGLFYPHVAAPPVTSDTAPHFPLTQVRTPLSSFTGVDLTKIRKVTVGFGGASPPESGSLGLSDLLLAS